MDKMGTLVGVRRCGKPGAKRLLLDAHLDEIGLVVTGHQDGLFALCPPGQGLDPRMLPDREVLLLTQPPIPAVVACLPPHIQSREEMDRSTPIRELYLDAGTDPGGGPGPHPHRHAGGLPGRLRSAGGQAAVRQGPG